MWLLKVVHGSFHQGDHRFLYRGVQCMAIALVSLARHTVKSVFSWDSFDLDRVLVEGDKLYCDLRSKNLFSHVSNLLSVPDLPKVFPIDRPEFSVSCGDTWSGEVGVTSGEWIDLGVYVSMQNGLERIFSQYSTCLLTLCGNTSAIICEDGQFAVVDSHSRSSCGLVHGDGTSVVLYFSCLDDLISVVWQTVSLQGRSPLNCLPLVLVALCVQQCQVFL
ncbi:uncharacterized protein LOC115439442 [Sphaeramia orbicularis]|uniref:uncharacterized protein LOC115439442 n=1 Tax=Sphaeramia orbicularis TaxID=375764 RepID=UPI00117D3B6E|nr:uncharacterized protein LOC115439442 [Sphaeramia orbicularis]